MNNCPWEEILGFKNLYELNSFAKWLENKVDEHEAQETSISGQFSADGYSEKGFIHKGSNSIWRLVWAEGPSYINSFRFAENQDRCPWNEITGTGESDEAKCGFTDYRDFENFVVWIEKQVMAGIAKEIKVESPEDDPSSKKWYIHSKSGLKWKLVWPDGPCRPYFKRLEIPQK